MIKRIMVVLLMVLSVATVSIAQEDGSDWDWDPYKPAMVEITYAHVADLVSTGLALSIVDTATEGNILGWYAVAGKVVTTYGLVPLLPHVVQVPVAHVTSDIIWGASVNNTLILLGASGSVPIVGFVVTSAYLMLCDFEVLPDYVCISGGYTSE